MSNISNIFAIIMPFLIGCVLSWRVTMEYYERKIEEIIKDGNKRY